MASSASSTQRPPPPPPTTMTATTTTTTTMDAVLRNTLRYTISAREYAALHKYVLSRSRALRRAAPLPATVDKAFLPPPTQQQQKKQQKKKTKRQGQGQGQDVGKAAAGATGGDDYNARAVRHALRVFAATLVGVKAWEAVMRRLGRQRSGQPPPQITSPSPSPALRLSVSLSTILLLYRFLFRFLSRLRAHLLAAQVEPFRRRNPRTSAALTSPYAPAVGASLAGLALGVCPAQQLRVTIAIYALFRALEFGWNVCETEGLVWGSDARTGRKRERPWWFGSWMLQPLAFGQLLHAVAFDRDCFAAAYGRFIFKNSEGYLHAQPAGYSGKTPWPSTNQVVESLAQMARLHWPAYISPTMFPNKPDVLPPSLAPISPLTSQAHPLITSLSCAALHPSDPSCTRTLLTFWLNSFPPMAHFFLVFYSALTVVPRFKRLYNYPVSTVRGIIARALRMSTFATGAISTAWASICFFQTYLPKRVLATQRFFLGGFFAGLWAWVERRHGRGVFLYSARASVDSLWKVGVKRRWWKAMKGGDVWVFVLAVMATGVVYERDSRAIREKEWRKGVSWIRGEGWRDWAIEDEMDNDDDDDDDDDDKDAPAEQFLKEE